MADGPRQLKCLLLPMVGAPALVPNSAVAELITQQDVIPGEDTPEWFLGTGTWRGLEIPLIAFDRLCGERQDAPRAYGRFVVLFGLEREGAPAYYGVRIEALPRAETVDHERLVRAEGPAHESPYVATRARVRDRDCLVPDFEALGRAIAQYAEGAA